MKDRIDNFPYRHKLVPVEGQPDVYDLIPQKETVELGTPLNKANILKDETAALYGLSSSAVPDDVFKKMLNPLAVNTLLSEAAKVATNNAINADAGLINLATKIGNIKPDSNLKLQCITSYKVFEAPKTGNYFVICQASGGKLPNSSAGTVSAAGAGGCAIGLISLEKEDLVIANVSSTLGTAASFGSYLSAKTGNYTNNSAPSSIANANISVFVNGGTATGGVLNIAGGDSRMSVLHSGSSSALIMQFDGGNSVLGRGTRAGNSSGMGDAITATGFGAGGVGYNFSEGAATYQGTGGAILIIWVG